MVRSERGVPRIGKSRGKDGRIIRFINGDGGGVTFRKSWSARRRSLGGKAGGFGKRSHSCRICNRGRGGGVGRTLQYIYKDGGGIEGDVRHWKGGRECGLPNREAVPLPPPLS